MSIEKIIPIDKELVNIFGVNDQNLKYLKDKFKKIKINVKGNVLYISGDNAQTTDVMKILDEMLSIADRGEIIEIEDLKLMSNIDSNEISNISSSNNISSAILIFTGCPSKAYAKDFLVILATCLISVFFGSNAFGVLL